MVLPIHNMSKTSRVALVSGASRGIGRAIAEKLQQQGFTVIGTATTEKGAAELNSWLGDGQGRVLDCSDRNQCADCVQAINNGFGPPAVLVNNAAITRDSLALRMNDQQWNAVIDTDLNGAYYLCRAVIRGMVRQHWGRMINIGSVVGATGNSGQVNYAAAKAALGGLSRSLALELAPRGITVNVIAPGFILTDMTAEINDTARAAILTRIPVKRFAEPQEVASLAAFLISDEASYITGQTLHINGGMLMAG